MIWTPKYKVWAKKVSIATATVACGCFATAFVCLLIAGHRQQEAGLEVSPTPSFQAATHAGGVINATFRARNLGDTPIRILGAKFSCSCMVTSAFPLELQPGAEHLIDVRLQINELQSPGTYTQTVSLFTTHDGTVPPLVIEAVVTSPPTD